MRWGDVIALTADNYYRRVLLLTPVQTAVLGDAAVRCPRRLHF